MSRRILVTSTAMRIGGVERALVGLLDSLIREGHEVSLFLWAHEGEFMGLLPPGVHLLPEIPAYARLERPIRKAVAQGFPGIGLARLAAKAITAFRAEVLRRPGYLLPRSVRYCIPFLPPVPGHYDLVLSFLAPHDIAARKISASCRAGWIHTDYGSLECGVDTTFEASMWQSMDALMAVSEGVRDSFISVFPTLADRVQVMENILSPDFIRQQADEDVSKEMPFEPGIIHLCSVGRFSHAKNFDAIPEAVRRLGGSGRSVKWYIIGYGPEEELIRRRIQEAGVQDRVIILGKKVNPYPYMKACDTYVQPSRYEGKAVTVQEAQILGKPVLITNFPTAGSQVQDGVDGLIAPMEMDGLVGGIRKLIEDPALRERLAATAASRDYCNRSEVEKILRLIKADP
ncbi:MAG: glycosyltransferase [Holophagaceae bacterium]|nr:glycosyltransferase [Holophagaceae bacterium]